MVTLRTYANPVEAGLAKSLLNDYEILCALADEDTNRYSGAPFAVPIRLLVHEDQVEQATRILRPDLEEAAKIDAGAEATSWQASPAAAGEAANNNPWELLVIAFYFFLPGICVLRTKYPAVVASRWLLRREIAAVTVIHFLGWLAIGFAAFLIALYFRVWRSSDKPPDGEDADTTNDDGSSA
jgi:hypothetical protein